MGIEAIYIAGTPFINQPWGADGYSPLDLSLLDQHFGDIDDWRAAVSEIHSRGMYGEFFLPGFTLGEVSNINSVVLDNTVSTLGDLIAFEGLREYRCPFLHLGTQSFLSRSRSTVLGLLLRQLLQ